MAELSKIVNVNDNLEHKGLYFKRICPVTGENEENWRKYLPIAHYLIAKFEKEPWKANPFSSQYSFIEWQLCTAIRSIDNPNYYPKRRNDFIESLAAMLGTKPINLHNDKDLPF
jgi:hypothetical protein